MICLAPGRCWSLAALIASRDGLTVPANPARNPERPRAPTRRRLALGVLERHLTPMGNLQRQ